MARPDNSNKNEVGNAASQKSNRGSQANNNGTLLPLVPELSSKQNESNANLAGGDDGLLVGSNLLKTDMDEEVPLNNILGTSTDNRSVKGKGNTNSTKEHLEDNEGASNERRQKLPNSDSFVGISMTREIEYDFENFKKNEKAYNKLSENYRDIFEGETAGITEANENLKITFDELFDVVKGIENKEFDKALMAMGESQDNRALIKDYCLNRVFKNQLLLDYNKKIKDFESSQHLYASSLQKLKSLNNDITKLSEPSNRIFFKKTAEKKRKNKLRDLLALRSEHIELSIALASKIGAFQLLLNNIQGKIHDLIKDELENLNEINSTSLIKPDKLYRLIKKYELRYQSSKEIEIINKVNKEQYRLLNNTTTGKGVFYYAYDPNKNDDFTKFFKMNAPKDLGLSTDSIQENLDLQQLLEDRNNFLSKLNRNTINGEISRKDRKQLNVYERNFRRKSRLVYENLSTMFEERLNMLAILENKIGSLKLEITKLSKRSNSFSFGSIINRSRKVKIEIIQESLKKYENLLPALKANLEAIRGAIIKTNFYIEGSLMARIEDFERSENQNSMKNENEISIKNDNIQRPKRKSAFMNFLVEYEQKPSHNLSDSNCIGKFDVLKEIPEVKQNEEAIADLFLKDTYFANFVDDPNIAPNIYNLTKYKEELVRAVKYEEDYLNIHALINAQKNLIKALNDFKASKKI
jgi:hypothetical protein